MILTFDIGNTNIVAGVYRADDLAASWRLATNRDWTAERLGNELSVRFDAAGLRLEEVQGTVVSSVVPSLVGVVQAMGRKLFGGEPVIVGPETAKGIEICYDEPAQLGPDRIANAVGAYEKYARSLIVVDMGTATTLDYVSADGRFLGGAIAPGIVIGAEALFERAARLPRVELKSPLRATARNTAASMQSGIVLGHASMVDGMVDRIKAESGDDPTVVATGGLAKVIAACSRSIDEVDENLTLWGLKVLFIRQRDGKK